MPPEVCMRIKSNRNRLGLTQTELGTMLGLQKSAIQKYESGATDIKVTTLYKLAEIFGVTPSYLLGETVSSSHLMEYIYKTYGAIGIELFDRFTDLNEAGKMKVLAYAQDISATYHTKGDE